MIRWDATFHIQSQLRASIGTKKVRVSTCVLTVTGNEDPPERTRCGRVWHRSRPHGLDFLLFIGFNVNGSGTNGELLVQPTALLSESHDGLLSVIRPILRRRRDAFSELGCCIAYCTDNLPRDHKVMTNLFEVEFPIPMANPASAVAACQDTSHRFVHCRVHVGPLSGASSSSRCHTPISSRIKCTTYGCMVPATTLHCVYDTLAGGGRLTGSSTRTTSIRHSFFKTTKKCSAVSCKTHPSHVHSTSENGWISTYLTTLFAGSTLLRRHRQACRQHPSCRVVVV